MAELKTRKNDASVLDFIQSVEHEKRRQDSLVILDLLKEITGEEPAMWGSNIVGFGSYHSKYATGREGDWFVVGFSPRKRNLTLYIMSGFEEYGALLAELGKFKTGKSCLYINKLEDISEPVLRELVQQSVARMSGSGA